MQKVAEHAKSDLKWVALDHYEQTNDKNPCDGIKIIENTNLIYIPKNAIMWAAKNDTSLLSLKKQSFETMVRKLINTPFLPEFLTTEKVIAVRITLKDL